MSTNIIQAQYEQLDNIADRFGNQAETNADLYNRVQQGVQALQQGGWEGEGVEAFLTEMEGEVFPAMQRLTGALEEAQSVTIKIKNIIQKAEEEASAGFRDSDAIVAGAAAINSAQAAVGITGNISAVSSVIGNILKGVRADKVIPQRFVLRALTPNVARRQSTVAVLMDMLAGRKGRGLPLIRFDGPHGGSPFPHINLEPKLTGFKDPHLPISPRLLNVASKGARLLEGVRKIALPVALAVDAFRLGDAFHIDGNQVGRHTKKTIGSVAGGWGGAFAGAKVGAVGGAWLGGLIGSAVPVVGTAVGAGVGGFLGGLAGGIGGAIGGSSLGEAIGGLF